MSAAPIPILDLSPEINSLWPEINETVARVLRSGQFILGPDVKLLEQETAQYLGVKHAVGVNSGTDALIIGLRALGIGPGDEVITTPFTFIATAEAIKLVGAEAVFVDIDPKTFNLNPDLIAKKITPRTRAILPVHLFGQAADMDAVLALAKQYNLPVLEDVAQAFGAEYQGKKLGTLGNIGAFSFFPTKNLGGCGDGGLITTNDDKLAETARMLRVHGSKSKYYNELLGYNSRLDTLQAAILRVKLPHVDQWNEGRRRAARMYSTKFKNHNGLTTPFEAADRKHIYNQYTLRIHQGKRDEVQKKLKELGIGTMTYYPVPVHRLPVFADWKETLPESEQAAGEVLSLPMWPSIGEDIIDRVVQSVQTALL